MYFVLQWYWLFQLVHTSITEQDFGTTEPGLLLMSDLHDQYLGSCSLYTDEKKWLIKLQILSRSSYVVVLHAASSLRRLFTLKQKLQEHVLQIFIDCSTTLCFAITSKLVLHLIYTYQYMELSQICSSDLCPECSFSPRKHA